MTSLDQLEENHRIVLATDPAWPYRYGMKGWFYPIVFKVDKFGGIHRYCNEASRFAA